MYTIFTTRISFGGFTRRNNKNYIHSIVETIGWGQKPKIWGISSNLWLIQLPPIKYSTGENVKLLRPLNNFQMVLIVDMLGFN